MSEFNVENANSIQVPVNGTNKDVYKIANSSGTALWRKKFNFTYYPNGGTGTTYVQKVKYDLATTLHKNSFTYDGHTFDGWSDTSTGEAKYSDEQSFSSPNENLDFYACWSADPKEAENGTNGVLYNGNPVGINGTAIAGKIYDKYDGGGVIDNIKTAFVNYDIKNFNKNHTDVTGKGYTLEWDISAGGKYIDIELDCSGWNAYRTEYYDEYEKYFSNYYIMIQTYADDSSTSLTSYGTTTGTYAANSYPYFMIPEGGTGTGETGYLGTTSISLKSIPVHKKLYAFVSNYEGNGNMSHDWKTHPQWASTEHSPLVVQSYLIDHESETGVTLETKQKESNYLSCGICIPYGLNMKISYSG